MKIIIASYYFYPEITPRAFRTFELAKEFAIQGHDVTLIVPKNNFDYTELSNEFNLSIYTTQTGFLFNKNAKLRAPDSRVGKLIKRESILHHVLSNMFQYVYMGRETFEYSFYVMKKILGLHKDFDLLISVGLPISVHIGTGMAIMFKKCLCKVAVADYGDPFSSNAEFTIPTIHKYIEKQILKRFNFIAVPIPEAKNAFLEIKDETRIHIIPQGYDFTQFKTVHYSKNEIVSFAYAGVFYENTRNPLFFFEFLTTIKDPFNFILYTDTTVYQNMKLIIPYLDRLKNKITIHSLVPQKQCIFELSKFDFLINFENNTKKQIPSKLIDYNLTKRPVYSFNKESFNQKEFFKFLNGNYENDFMRDFNISNYDIKVVAKQFLSLNSGI